MNSELPVSADALLAERARLEDVLQSSEDWCELLRLKSRKDRGEGISAVNAARLEMVLIDALAEDEDFIRYKAVCVALERLIRGLPPLPPKGEKPPVEKDDLTEIEGITASMQRRLNALDVMNFMQIAEWSPADVKSISADLGIGRQIYEQDWIGQAEELATRSDAPPPPPPAPKYVAPQRQVAAPTPPPPRPVETRQPSVEKPAPQIVREPPRPVVEAKPEVKPVELKPEPVAAKPAPHIAPKIETKAEDFARPDSANARPAEPVAAKPEPKSEPKNETPSQTASTKSDPKDQSAASAAAPASASSSTPLADPPRPLKPETYRGPVVEAEAKANANDALNNEPARLLPMPPSPLRVQAPAGSSAQPNKTASPAVAPVQLGTPPKPFVITRASLPPLPKADVPPAPPVAHRQPEPPRMPAASATSAPTAKPDSGPFAALAALKTAPATPASSTPSMSIAEAIAYAAEVARQSPTKTPASPPSAASGAPANGAVQASNAPPQQKLEPARPPVAAQPAPPPPKPAAATPPARPTVQAAPSKPAVPPPLPEGFVPPPEDAEPEPTDYRSARGQSLNGTRDDGAAHRMYAEEATVEIVVKSAPELMATPRAALAKVATESTASAPRPATPIGRFLKALTGN